jgi:hypothetical protein
MASPPGSTPGRSLYANSKTITGDNLGFAFYTGWSDGNSDLMAIPFDLPGDTGFLFYGTIGLSLTGISDCCIRRGRNLANPFYTQITRASVFV